MQLYQLQTASMTEKNSFNITNLLHQKLSGTVVQWSRSYYQVQMNYSRFDSRRSSLLILNLYIFLCLVFCFSILFFLLACLPLLTLTTDSLRGFCDNVFPVTWHLCGLPIARAFTLYHTKKTKLLEIRYRENLAKL